MANGKNVTDEMEQVREQLAAWDGGHADVYDEEGTLVCDVEV